MNRLPVYRITIEDEYENDELGWTKTAFTSRPAIVVKGMAFSTEEVKQMYFKDDLKYRIAAPAMIPSKIYRNQDGEEFYVEFTKEEIDRIHKKFMKNFSKNKNLFNLEHNSEEQVPAYLLECWIVDNPAKDKSFSTYGVKVPEGSLFMVAQITDKEYYNQLVAEDRIGFSIEGFFELALSSDNITINKENKFNEMEKELMLPDGEHTINDKIYVVRDGKLVEIKDIVKEEMAEEIKEEVIEDVKEEEIEMAEEPVIEEVVEAPAEEVVVEETYSKAEIDAKFDELYKLIAELKTEEAEEMPTEEVELPKGLAAGFAAMKRALK